jgi:peptide/nickel transport system permease protein
MTIDAAVSAKPKGAQRRSRRRLNLAATWVAGGWLALVLICAAAPGLISPADPLAQSLDHMLAMPSPQHLLGTDNLGRDVLSRVIWGAQPAVIGVLIAMTTALVAGVVWGLLAGYLGGVFDQLLMRFADIMLAFPSIIFALALATILGGSLPVTMFAVGIALAPPISRLMRAGVVTVRDRDYVTVTRLYGVSEARRVISHVLPNAFSPVLVQLTIFSGIALLAQTGLGFLGVGTAPPAASWGGSLAESFRYISSSPWITFAPGAVVSLTVLALYQLGDTVRDRFSA